MHGSCFSSPWKHRLLRGTKGDVKTKFIKGACENCGATTHTKKAPVRVTRGADLGEKRRRQGAEGAEGATKSLSPTKGRFPMFRYVGMLFGISHLSSITLWVGIRLLTALEGPEFQKLFVRLDSLLAVRQDCVERPRAVTAKQNGKNLMPDEYIMERSGSKLPHANTSCSFVWNEFRHRGGMLCPVCSESADTP